MRGGEFKLALVLKSVSRTSPVVNQLRCTICKEDGNNIENIEIYSSTECGLGPGDARAIEKTLLVSAVKEFSDEEAKACDLKIRIWYRLIGLKEYHYDCQTILSFKEPGAQWDPIANPYRYWAGGRCCVGEHSEGCFVGRDEVLGEMLSVFGETSGGQCFVLYGQRRVGKTTLYEQLKWRLGDDRFVYVQIPAHAAFECGENYCSKFRTRLLSDLSIKKELPDFPIDEEADVDVSIRNLVEQLRSRGKVLVVGIDEFTSIYEDFIDQKKGGPDEQIVRSRITKFLQLLKLSLDAGLYHLLLLGRPSMERFKAEFGVELAAMDNMRPFWGLDDMAVRKLVYEKFYYHGRSLFKRVEVYDRFCDLVGGSPYLIHKFCSFLVDYLNRNHYPMVDEAQLDVVCRNLCRVGMRQLSIAEFKQWYEFKLEGVEDVDMLRFELHVARCISKGVSDKNGLIGSDDGYRRAFEIAVKWKVLAPVSQGSSHYKFTVGLFEEWLLANESVIRG